MAKSYEQSGVNLEAGYEVVRRIKQHVASTSRTGSMGNIGSFGGMFDLSVLGVKEPVLVSGTDGVGTKLKIAFAMDKHDTIGIDAVAMCVQGTPAEGCCSYLPSGGSPGRHGRDSWHAAGNGSAQVSFGRRGASDRTSPDL